MDKHKPGYNEDSLLQMVTDKVMTKVVEKLLSHIGKDKIQEYGLSFADIGTPNPKMEKLKELLRIAVDQIAVPDFNFDPLPKHKKYDVIFCLEVLEHLQNPLFLMRELKSILSDIGTIFLTMPSNPYFLKYDYHFNEMRKKDFIKWILDPLDLVLVRHRRYNFMRDWRALFVGIRPLLRSIRDRDFRPTFWALIQVNNFYEITKDNNSAI